MNRRTTFTESAAQAIGDEACAANAKQRKDQKSLQERDRLNVVMVVACFPCKGKPKNGIFNLRAARGLQEFVNVSVIHLRTWLPGRSIVQHSEMEDIPVTTLAIPQSPWGATVNIALYHLLGWSNVRSLVQNCDLVHSVGTAAGILGSIWARRARRHHIFQATGSDINAFFPRFKTSLGVAGWENYVHAVACNSGALASGVLALYPGSRNVRTVWRGVDLNSFSPSGPVSGPLADKPPVRYLYLGGFPKNRALPFGANTKGGETLLQSWQAAEDELAARGASLLVLGCDGHFKRVSAWRARLRSPEKVHLAGFVPPEKVSAYIRSSDAVLVPSIHDGLPNVAVEACACARPVFASNIGGNSEVIVNEETGILLPPGDVAAWKRALITYADRPSCLREMGNRARKRMETLFDCSNFPQGMLNLYEAALREQLHT